MFDKGGPWHNTIFSIHDHSLPSASSPSRFFQKHPRLPPSMWKVLGKASSNMSCINKPNLEPTSSRSVPQLGVAGEFPVDGDENSGPKRGEC